MEAYHHPKWDRLHSTLSCLMPPNIYLPLALKTHTHRPATPARLATLAMLVCALAVAALWLAGGTEQTFQQTLYTWMSVGDWRPAVGLRVDKITLVMVSVAGWVGGENRGHNTN